MFSILPTQCGSIRIACRIIRLVGRVRLVFTANSWWKPGECSWGCGIASERRLTTEDTEEHRGIFGWGLTTSKTPPSRKRREKGGAPCLVNSIYGWGHLMHRVWFVWG